MVISDVYFVIFTALFLSLFSCLHNVTPFTLYAVLVYFQLNYGLLLYLKLPRVDVVNVSKKGENMEGIITWSIFASWFLTELCLYILWTIFH